MPPDEFENPFAYQRKSPPAYHRLWWAALVAVIAGVALSPQLVNHFLLNRLTADIDQLPADTHVDRLISVSQLGTVGVPVLVGSLASKDQAVAQSAFEILKSMQDAQMQKSTAEGVAMHQAITTELVSRRGEIPPHRYSWLKELLNQTLLDTLNVDSESGRGSYQTATTLLARIALEPDPSVLRSRPGPVDTPNTNPPEPLLVDSSANLQPLPLRRVPTVTTDNAFNDDVWLDPSGSTTRVDTDGDANARESLQPAMIPTGPVETSDTRTLPIGLEANILSAGSYATTNPLEAYSTRAVIDLLSSVREPLSTAAQDELTQRGFSAAELKLARRLASNNASVRLALIDEVPHRSDIDPRQWLLWLAEDGERAVRLQALSALGTMDDPNVVQQLRELLLSEQDPTVATRIRQALVR